jgi:hypothetical protein
LSPFDQASSCYVHWTNRSKLIQHFFTHKTTNALNAYRDKINETSKISRFWGLSKTCTQKQTVKEVESFQKWYVAPFQSILIIFSYALFLTINRQRKVQLDSIQRPFKSFGMNSEVSRIILHNHFDNQKIKTVGN